MKNFLKWYSSTFLSSLFLLIGVLSYFGLSFDEIKIYYLEVLTRLMQKWFFWLALTIPYLLFRLFKYLFMSYKNHGSKTFLRRSTFSIVLPIALFFSLFNISKWYTKNENFTYEWNTEIENKNNRPQGFFAEDEKQRGVHVFGKIDSTNLQPLIRNNVEWITYVPFADQEDYDTPEITNYLRDSLRRLRSDSIWQNKINLAHAAGFKVFVKPHIWLGNPSNGKWRSDIFPSNDENWELWKTSYREFILRHAQIAQQTKVELFCIGTELTRLSVEKNIFWKNLIREVRTIYSGEITYAANWHDEFEKITFWDELDYIGIQAYFPLVKNKTPSVRQISKGWKKHLPAIKSIHKKFDKKILFTELGYKSTTDSAIEPWSWVDYSSNLYKPISTETQVNCYLAFFETVWEKEWFAGVHIWQWHTSEEDGGKDNLDFTPRKKPAENVIAKGFGK